LSIVVEDVMKSNAEAYVRFKAICMASL